MDNIERYKKAHKELKESDGTTRDSTLVDGVVTGYKAVKQAINDLREEYHRG